MSDAERGDRVRLISCHDLWTRLTPGTEGTVVFVDDLGTVHIHWDDGSTLGMIPTAGDWFELLDEPTRAPRES